MAETTTPAVVSPHDNPLTKPRRRLDPRAAYAAFVQALEASAEAEGKENKKLACPVADLNGANVMGDLLPKLGHVYGLAMQGACQAFINGTPFVDLGTFPVVHDLARNLPPASLPQYKYLVLGNLDRAFVVASPYPTDPGFKMAVVRRLESVVQKRIPLVFHVLAQESSLDPHLPMARAAAESGVSSMGRGLKLSGKTLKVAGRVVEDKPLTVVEMEKRLADALDAKSEDVPRFMLDLIIARGYSPDDPTKRSSDVHIEPGPPEGDFVIRFRVDGRLTEVDHGPMDFYSNFSAAIKGLCSGMQVTDKGKLQDGRYWLRLMGKNEPVKLDLRVSCVPQGSETGGDAPEKFVFRILDSSADRPPLIDLVGGDVKMEKLLRDCLALPKGLILLTGPTGCGKTTTLSRFVMELARERGYAIYTIEDPIEYEYSPHQGRINQVQVDPGRGITFSGALRTFLRMDPDIILVGELRDSETAKIATEAALTGHQVLSTLHTNDAIGAVSRLQDMGVPGYLLSETLACVVAQRLLPALCPNCKEVTVLPPKALELLPEDLRGGTFAHALGCPKCRGLGYRGRVPVVDVFYLDEEAKRMVANGKSLAELRKYNQSMYSPGLPRRALELASAGRIDLATALTVRDDVTVEG